MSSWYDTGMAYNKANQLVASTAPDGKVTKYAYDAAGRMVKEGAKSYRYGYLDKVMSMTEGDMVSGTLSFSISVSCDGKLHNCVFV